MSTEESAKAGSEHEEEIAALLEVLRTIGQRFEDLTCGQVDTVADSEGRILFLRGTREQLEQSETSRQAGILNALTANIALLDSDGIITSVNESWRMFASSNDMQQAPGHWLGLNYLDVCDNVFWPDVDEAHMAAVGIRSVLNGSRSSFYMDYRCDSPVEPRWFHLSVNPLSKDRLKGVVVMHEDITAGKRDQSRLASLANRLALATEVAKVGVWEWDLASNDSMWDATMFSIYGFSPTDSVPYDQWSAAVHPDDLPGFETILKKVIVQPTEEMIEFRIMLEGGEVKHLASAERPVLDEFGKVCRIVGVNFDITERKKAEEELRKNQAIMTHLAQHDFLTGLPNQMVLRDRIEQAIKAASRYNTTAAVLFIDLDGFKHINDSLGHTIGDKLLQSIAIRLRESVRALDTVSRFGGDEFVVLLPQVDPREGTIRAVTRIMDAFAAIHPLGQHQLQIGACVGISLYPNDGLDSDTLIKNADAAMYQAKAKGGANYQFFHHDMNINATERQFIEQNLRRALERNELMLHYQPKVDLKTRVITGVEALLRWNHGTRGSISPDQFISVAEDCGLMLPIGTWVLEQACAQARAWLDAGFSCINISVNVSGRQFESELFEAKVKAVLSETCIEPQYLELEVTESLLMKSPEQIASLLQNLRAKGVKVAIDDFGTGYSSLSYLQRFPIDTLKVDQSFIRQLNTRDGVNIVSAIIDMGRNLGMRIVAEGVETELEAAALESMGCQEAQGYLFSRPIPPAEFIALLERNLESVKVPFLYRS